MERMILTRRQYDALVRRCAAWMDLRWGSFTRRWFIGGVEVIGTPHAIENLKAQLVWAENPFTANTPL